MTCLELKIPPLFVVLAFGSAMWLLAHASPSYQFNLSHPHIVGLALAVAGLLISAAGFFAFRAARTTSNPMKPATSSALVVSGIYKRINHAQSDVSRFSAVAHRMGTLFVEYARARIHPPRL